LSTWEDRRKKSVSYYICLLILLWPLIYIPLGLIVSVAFVSWQVLFTGVVSSVALIGVALGCGANYRSRGINPSSRNILNYNDGHYFERIGADESDYP